MLKNKSKSKIKVSCAGSKKELDIKPKCSSRDAPKKHDQRDKQNAAASKLCMTVVHSKRKNKKSGDNSRAVSPLCFKKKNEDDNFIESLFSKTYELKHKEQDKATKNYLVEQLIQGLVPEQSTHQKVHEGSHSQSTDLAKQLHIKNQEVATLHQQIQELKLYISNFTFKVFDLSVLCRKHSCLIDDEEESLEFNRKTDEVIAYLDSLVRHWRLEDKIKLHCQAISKKMSFSSTSRTKNEDSRKRCHTESLKIPIEDYLETLQNTGKDTLKIQLKNSNTNIKQEENQEIMKILSRRSSGTRKEQQEIYVAIQGHAAKSEHELNIKIGDRVSVLQKNGNQRWLGFKDGKIGYFPKNCLF